MPHGWKFYGLIVAIVLLSLSTGLNMYSIHHRTDSIDTRLRTAKVCSDMNRGQACRDLFDRLATSISDEQRARLACVVFQYAGVKPAINCPQIPTNEGKP